MLTVTDHTCRPLEPGGVDAATWAAYAIEVAAEAERAHTLYDLLVLPGLELTWNEVDPAQ